MGSDERSLVYTIIIFLINIKNTQVFTTTVKIDQTEGYTRIWYNYMQAFSFSLSWVPSPFIPLGIICIAPHLPNTWNRLDRAS